MSSDSEDLIPLADAVARYHQQGGGNAYGWYQNSARSHGTVYIGERHVPAVKVSGRWHLSAAAFAQAMEAEQARRAELARRTDDYDAGILHAGGVVKLQHGRSYLVVGDFHQLTVPQPMAPAVTLWKCNRCQGSAQTIHDGEECHRCRDWSPCGRDCTLTGLSCPACGTSMTLSTS